MGNMEHWNHFLQSVLADTKQDESRNSMRKSEDKEAGSTHLVDIKKGVKNNEQKQFS